MDTTIAAKAHLPFASYTRRHFTIVCNIIAICVLLILIGLNPISNVRFTIHIMMNPTDPKHK